MAKEMSKEESMRAYYETRMLQTQIQEGERQLAQLSKSLEEARTVIDTLDAVGNAKDEALIPVGSGVLLRCKGVDGGKVLLESGAGVVMEKNVADAKAVVAERAAKLEETINRMSSELAKLSALLEENAAKLQHEH